MRYEVTPLPYDAIDLKISNEVLILTSKVKFMVIRIFQPYHPRAHAHTDIELVIYRLEVRTHFHLPSPHKHIGYT